MGPTIKWVTSSRILALVADESSRWINHVEDLQLSCARKLLKSLRLLTLQSNISK